MKVAITSQGNQLSSEVDPRFGRCAWFILGDTDDGSWEAVDNTSSQQAAHGAGIQSAQTVARHGAQAVLTGHCGPKAFGALTAGGIKIVEGATGTVADALEKYKSEGAVPSTGDEPRGHCQGKNKSREGR
jgi:predicted Fe-Mo cluster-binding NifX family protein